MNNELNKKFQEILGIKEEIVEMLLSEGQDGDVGEMIYKIDDDDNVYIMDITYQPGYHLLPIPAREYAKELAKRIWIRSVPVLEKWIEEYREGIEVNDFAFDTLAGKMKALEEEFNFNPKENPCNSAEF